ncbi:MAG: hypothetical protein R3F56_00105 [Planctomycetota bacterium]
MNPLPLPRALCLSLAALLAACSSGGGDSGRAAAPQNRTLMLDTAAGGDHALDVRVDVLALETTEGAFTANLLPAGATLPLVRPSGSTSGLGLPGVPAGTYVALRLLVADGGVLATGREGRPETVVMATRDLRVPLLTPVTVDAGTVSWLVLAHDGAPALARDGSGRLTWTPSLTARAGDVQPVRDTTLTVTSVTGGEILGFLPSCGDLSVRGRIDDSSELTDDSGRHDRSSFLGSLRGSDDLVCEGVLSHDGSFHLHRAHRRGQGANDSKLYGEIVELLPSVPAARVQVQEIVRGGSGIGTPLPVLTVTTSGARIHRSGERNLALDFSALATGQRIEVEWHGLVTNDTIAAREVEIEDEAGNGRGIAHESQGQVQSVDVTQGVLVAVPRGNDPLVVGNQQVPSATVVIGPGTVIVREANGVRGTATLADAQPGDRVWFWGRAVETQRVEATAVRLRAPR